MNRDTQEHGTTEILRWTCSAEYAMNKDVHTRPLCCCVTRYHTIQNINGISLLIMSSADFYDNI